jgi:hypothetical protein
VYKDFPTPKSPPSVSPLSMTYLLGVGAEEPVLTGLAVLAGLVLTRAAGRGTR